MLDYAKHLTIVGYNDRAIAMTEKVGEIDPHNPLLGFMEALLAWQTNPTSENAETFIGRFGSQPGFDPLILRSTMGYFVDSDQVDRLRTLLQDCTKCEPAWRDTALAMVDAVGKESPEAIFDKYKDSRIIGYSFLDAIGGPDLVLKAFKYFADDQAFRFEYYLVPWTELDQVGKTEEFQQLIGDVGLVEYWRERGWPERCQPLEGSQFECGCGQSFRVNRKASGVSAVMVSQSPQPLFVDRAANKQNGNQHADDRKRAVDDKGVADALG